MSVFSQNPELLPFKRAVVGCCRGIPDDRLRQKVLSFLGDKPEFSGMLSSLVTEETLNG